MKRKASFLRDLLFPPACIGCGELLPTANVGGTASPEGGDEALCPRCRVAWEAARIRHFVTGDASDEETAEAASVDAIEDGHVSAGRVALVTYRPGDPDGVPQKVIYHLKHKDDRRAFDWVARQLAPAVIDSIRAAGQTPATVVVTYPPRRPAALRKDGFDQAERIASALARRLGATCLPLLKRTSRHVSRGGRSTTGGREQKRLGATERVQNAEASFALRDRYLRRGRGRYVVLVDDLCTTGATLAAGSHLLTAAGACGILWVTVAETEAHGHGSRGREMEKFSSSH